MHPGLISRTAFLFATVTSILLYLAAQMAFPQLVVSVDMGVAMLAFFVLRPLMLVLLCVALVLICARRARTIGLLWAWGLAVPVLVGMDWMNVMHGPLALVEPSAFPVPLPFPWAASTAALLMVIFWLLPTGAFLSDHPGAHVAGYAVLLFIVLALAAGFVTAQSPYASPFRWLSSVAIGGLTLSAIALLVLARD